jgi:hypothetical protein
MYIPLDRIFHVPQVYPSPVHGLPWYAGVRPLWHANVEEKIGLSSRQCLFGCTNTRTLAQMAGTMIFKR